MPPVAKTPAAQLVPRSAYAIATASTSPRNPIAVSTEDFEAGAGFNQLSLLPERLAHETNVTWRSPGRNTNLVSCPAMSFQDDAVEPLAVESAAHFMELLRRAGARDSRDRYFDGLEPGRREQPERGRALPRDLGN